MMYGSDRLLMRISAFDVDGRGQTWPKQTEVSQSLRECHDGRDLALAGVHKAITRQLRILPISGISCDLPFATIRLVHLTTFNMWLTVGCPLDMRPSRLPPLRSTRRASTIWTDSKCEAQDGTSYS